MHVRAERFGTPTAARVRTRALAAGGVAGVAGAVAGALIPRGPVTTSVALVAVGTTLAVGFASGWLMRSRWAMLLSPAVFMLSFELARMRVDGPTVDGVRVDNLYGVLMLVAGRGVDAVLMLLPMMVGVSYGVVLANRLRALPDTRTHRHWVRRGFLAVTTLAVVVLVAGLVRPASTEPIVGEDGEPVKGSVAELVDVRIDGHDQAIMLRGVSAEAPVLLYLEGGPGGTGIGRIRNSGEDLEQDFVVATWDQRGTGKSYDALDPTDTITVEQMVEDTLEVTNYLRDRFDEEKIYLVGSSWGTTIGVLAVQRSPELFHAYVGTGQMVDQFETDGLMYAESLADAQARDDQAMVQDLRDIGAPPYDDPLDYPVALSMNPKWIDFEHGEDYSESSGYPFSLFVSEYSLIEQLRGMPAMAETFAVLYPQLSDTDFRIQVPSLEVPVYLVEGKYEAGGRETLAAEWFTLLSAPSKRYLVFENSGHTPPYDEPGRFAEFMNGVLQAARAGTR